MLFLLSEWKEMTEKIIFLRKKLLITCLARNLFVTLRRKNKKERFFHFCLKISILRNKNFWLISAFARFWGLE